MTTTYEVKICDQLSESDSIGRVQKRNPMNILTTPKVGKNVTDAHKMLAKLCGSEQLTSAKDVSAYVMDVTPELAEKLLEMNFERNRGLRKSNLARFQNLLQSDEFFDGSAIRLSFEDGAYKLTDGQHRLWAIYESDLAATMVVVVTDGSAATDYSKVDTGGVLRSAFDTTMALDADGVLAGVNKTMLSAYLSAVRWIESGFSILNTRPVFTPDRYWNLASQWRAELDLILDIVGSAGGSGFGNKTRGLMRATVLAVALITAKYADPKIVRDFWGQVVADDGLRIRDPRKQLHNWLSAPGLNGQKGQMGSAIVAATCWNYFVNNEELGKLYRDKKMPNIALTPHPIVAPVSE